MFNVKDLDIKKGILPLFDFTLNEFASEKLSNLLLNLPINKEEIEKRQLILKGIIVNWDVLKEYSYNKGDLPEVYSFLNRVINGGLKIPDNRWEHILKMNFDKKSMLQLRASTIQFIRLFYRLSARYFSLLSTHALPLHFKNNIEDIQQFLIIPDTYKYEQAIIENNLGTKDIATILSLIKTNISAEKLASFWEHFFSFEANLSLVKAIKKYNLVFPMFREERYISLQEFYHPALKAPVVNSINTEENNVVLITGPNMSGKSTLLKSISLCVYLAHCGMAVPAKSCTIPYYDSINIFVNPHDDLQNGYSHFMTEVINLKNVLLEANQNKHCFAVFDELFKGTNVEDALAISTTTINGLSKFQDSIFFISTHLHALKENINQKSTQTFHLDCLVRNNKASFNYVLKIGWSDLKIGQLIFEQEGLNRLLL